MNYLVMGAGALGSVFGGLLAKNGRQVTFVGVDEHLLAMQKSGLTITGLWGESYIAEVHAHYGIKEVQGTFDVVLLCVKSNITALAAAQVLPFLRPDTLVVSIQNGLGNWEAIAEVVGEERTVGARIIFGAEILYPGTVKVTVYADKVLLGPLSPVTPTAHIQTIVDDLNAAGIPSALNQEITSQLWGKVLYDCALNALGAILKVPYGKLAEIAEIRIVMLDIIQEIFAVAKAKGIKLPFASPQDYYRTLMEVQIPPTATHRSSMLQDITSGRPTEVDALNGAIACYGRELGIPTPVNTVITAVIKGLETPHTIH